MFKRIVTATIAGSVALLCVLLSSPWPIAALFTIVAILGLFELNIITNRNNIWILLLFAVGAAVAYSSWPLAFILITFTADWARLFWIVKSFGFTFGSEQV